MMAFQDSPRSFVVSVATGRGDMADPLVPLRTGRRMSGPARECQGMTRTNWYCRYSMAKDELESPENLLSDNFLKFCYALLVWYAK